MLTMWTTQMIDTASNNGADFSDDNLADSGAGKIKKGPDAYRTISEVAEELHIPQHRLRSWETLYPGVKPFRGESGRRYYSPEHVETLRLISDLLYVQGYKGQGVLRVLREEKARKSLENRTVSPKAEENIASVHAAPAPVEGPILGDAADDIIFPEAPAVPEISGTPELREESVLVGETSVLHDEEDVSLSEYRETLEPEEKADQVLDECLTGRTFAEAEAPFSIYDTEEVLVLQDANQQLAASVRHLDAENEFLRSEMKEILEELQILRSLLPV
ncbi:MerR family transcriptional regulator [Gluconobacter cerinus]|uniref:MerR family transcriptional regulator n=1 Tax=Gluconobacter cerinus TaxID=38307 RepID=UPI0020112443|nr:MerR family transcriptional regulator [Gluconobacter cerinus]